MLHVKHVLSFKNNLQNILLDGCASKTFDRMISVFTIFAHLLYKSFVRCSSATFSYDGSPFRQQAAFLRCSRPITTMDNQSTRILSRWPSISRSHRVSNAAALNQIRLGMLSVGGMVIGILFV